MKGFKALYSALAKMIGTKLATGITVAALTVASTAGICVIGYSGHLIGNYIEAQQEEENTLLTYDSGAAEETSPESPQETEASVQNPEQNPGQNPEQNLEQNVTEETEEVNNKDLVTSNSSNTSNRSNASNKRSEKKVSPKVPESVKKPSVQTPVLAQTQKEEELSSTEQPQNEGVDISSSDDQSSESGSRNEGAEKGDSGEGSDPFEPTESGRFLNHKIHDYIEPMAFAIDTEAYKGLNFDSDSYDRMLTKQYTVMVYLCGTDLETGQNEEGTRDIMKMLSQEYDMDKINVLLCAGGTSSWKNTYMSKDGNDNCDNDGVRCNIYYLNPASEELKNISNRVDIGKKREDDITKNLVLNEDTLRLLVSLDPTDMGEDELLAGFINFSSEYFPAENYGAILWNHGGGINGRICFSDSNEEEGVTGSGITAEELECALASSTLGKNCEKLGFIGFDACMMGSTELAYNISPYCEYMVGSMEYTSGGWSYGDIFQYISKQEERDTLNKDIALMIADKYYETHSDNYDNVASIACYDLKEMQTTVDQINTVSDSILELYNKEIYPQHPELASECYRILKQAKLHSYENGTDVKWSTYQYVDQNSFFTYLKNAFGELEEDYRIQQEEEWSTDAQKAAETEILVEHLENLQTDIDEILKNDALLFAGAHYYGQEVFRKTEGDTGIDYSDFWKELRGEAIAGTNIYMPYDAIAGADMETYREMNLMDGYTRLLNQYMEQAGSQEEKERIERLIQEVDYADIFEAPALKTTEKGNVPYLQVQVKAEYEEGKKPEDGEDPYTDFADTLSAMKVYISNYQDLPSDQDNQYKDMVIADAKINFSSMTGENKQINVVLELLENVVGYLAQGELWQDDATVVWDWARESYLELDDNISNKSERINKLFSSDEEKLDATAWKTVSGMSYAKYTEGELEKLEDGKDAILYFKKVFSADSEEYHYEYQGASIEDENSYSLADNAAISFYHYYISEEGKEEVFHDIDVKLATDSSETICIYEKYLCGEEMSQYNSYTVGVESLGGECYIIPPDEDAQSDQYRDNPYKVGNEAETEAEANEETDPENPDESKALRNEEADKSEVLTETEEQTGSEVATETEERTGSEADTETEEQTGSEAATETEEQTGSEAATETEEQTESEAATETEEQTGSEAATETEEQTESEAVTETETAKESEPSEDTEEEIPESTPVSSDNSPYQVEASDENASKKEDDI